VTDRDYIVNEQLLWLTPFSQIDQPGLAWRTEKHEKKPLNIQQIELWG